MLKTIQRIQPQRSARLLLQSRIVGKCLPAKTISFRPLITIPTRSMIKPLISNQMLSFHTTSRIFKAEENEEAKNHQMLIGFTCKVCEERSHHVMSKTAYTKGVVLIQCPGCKNRHLIADNLGWFRDSKTTIEDLVKEKGEAIRKVIVDDQGVERMGDLMEWLPDIVEEEKAKKSEAKETADNLRKEKSSSQDE